MDSLGKDLTRLSQKVSNFCRLLDQDLLQTTPASEDIHKASRCLTFVSHTPLADVATNKLAVVVCTVTRTLSKALDLLLEEAPLTGDAESRFDQLKTSPTLILKVEDDAWGDFRRRLDMLIKCLGLIQALLIYQSKSLEGKDVSYFAAKIPSLYKKCSISCARMKSIIYKEMSKSSSDSDSNSDLDATDDSSNSDSNSDLDATDDSSNSESDDDRRSPINKQVVCKDKIFPIHPPAYRQTPPIHSDHIVAEARKDSEGHMNKMNILTKIMFWAPRAKAPKQTRLPHPHTCHITPNQFEVHRSNPVPLLKVITRQTQGIQINEALLSEKTVRNALTWYLTFEFAKTVITDKEWVQATVSWIRQADSGPSFSMSWRTSPDFVVKCADRILAQLSNTEPFAMYQWTTHSIKIVRDRARVIFKRSVSLLDDPKTTYQTACTCPTLGPGVPPPQGPPSMPLPSTLLRSGGPSPPPPPPGFRSTGTPRLIRTSKRPRRRSPLIVRDRNIELGDIPDLPQITGKKVMETLVKTYLKDAGSVV